MDSVPVFSGEWFTGVSFEPLVAFLLRWKALLKEYGVDLARHRKVYDRYGHSRIQEALKRLGPATPADLRQAIMDVVAMSNPKAHEIIIELAAKHGWELGRAPKVGWTCEDLALRAYVEQRELFDLAMATHIVRKADKWVDFVDPALRPLEKPIGKEEVARLTERMTPYWSSRERARYARVVMNVVDGSPTFFIYHAELTRSHTAIHGDSSRRVVRYNPEVVDVARIHPETSRLSVRTRYEPDEEAYRLMIGDVVFGDPERYQVCPLYSCEPLLKYGAAVLNHPAEHLFKVTVREAVLVHAKDPRRTMVLRGTPGGAALDNILHTAARAGYTEIRSLVLAFNFEGERGAIEVGIRSSNKLSMPYNLAHTDAIFRYLILKTFLKTSPKAGGKR